MAVYLGLVVPPMCYLVANCLMVRSSSEYLVSTEVMVSSGMKTARQLRVDCCQATGHKKEDRCESKDAHKENHTILWLFIVNNNDCVSDVSNLFRVDIEHLSAVLETENGEAMSSSENQSIGFGTDLRSLPDITVRLDADNVSNNAFCEPYHEGNLSGTVGEALFADDNAPAQPADDDWVLAKPKASEKGIPVSAASPNLINTTCTKSC